MGLENKRLVKVGDIVSLKKSERKFSKLFYDKKYEVLEIEANNGYWDGSSYITKLVDSDNNVISLRMYETFFDIMYSFPPEVVTTGTIARPVLEERKVGKVKMQLFDEGFPNAILEIAKVMGWAEENKGYKPNDFKNLPNAETEFSAAASRHRVKGFIQKAQGVPAIDRTDEESNIVHLAHAAFNILAELELVLTGKIK